MVSDFVTKQLRLIETRKKGALGWIDPAMLRETVGAGPANEVQEEVAARRQHLNCLLQPTATFLATKDAIASRQAIGEDEPPVAANDNQPKPKKRDARAVHKSTGKFVRGTFAESLQMLMALRNTPDHLPAPVTSSWSIDPSSVVADLEIDDANPKAKSKDPNDFSIEMLLGITPSLSRIRDAIENGDTLRGPPQKNVVTKKIAKRGPIVEIGKLNFSDGSQTEQAHRVREGKLEAFRWTLPLGAMLRTSEKLKPHIGGDAHATLSNRRLTGLIFNDDENGNPNNWHSFTPKGGTRKGRDYTAEQSRTLIAEALANTKVMPTVTKCPPGVASGTARYSDQFVGVVTASTGKGGAIQWVDVFEAIRNRQEWLSILNALDPKTTAVLGAALTARNFGEVGVAAGQSEKYARYGGGGKRALVAANDNLSAVVRKNAA